MEKTKLGCMVFARDKENLTRFYLGVTECSLLLEEGAISVLGNGDWELVIHALRNEPKPDPIALPRLDAFFKPFFWVRSLNQALEKAHDLGGRRHPNHEIWQARGFRACEVIDPEGNLIQIRESIVVSGSEAHTKPHD